MLDCFESFVTSSKERIPYVLADHFPKIFARRHSVVGIEFTAQVRFSVIMVP